MVDPVSFRLSLSAFEVKELTGWPEAMVEDYIQILSDLTTIINELNDNTSNIFELFNDYDNINSDLSGVRTLASKVRAKSNQLSKQIDDFNSQIINFDARLENLSQQVASAEFSKLRARLIQSVRDWKSWLPAKSVLIRIEGNGASNPVITNYYNVLSAVRSGVGVYQIVVTQSTFFTVNTLANSVFANSFRISPLTSSFQVEIITTGTLTFEIRAYELTVSGAAVQRSAYDLLAGDFVDVQALFSINNTLPPR